MENPKAWICLFKAVHFELVTSLSTSDFLLALRRLIPRKGRLHGIYSDNATNFTAAEKKLKKLDWYLIVITCTTMQHKVDFYTPYCPMVERVVRLFRILKGLFKRMLGRASLNVEEVVTVLSDCEAVVNSRPLIDIPEWRASGSDTFSTSLLSTRNERH